MDVAPARSAKGAERAAAIESVYALLDEALRIRDCWLLTLHVDRRFEPLWGERRFAEIVRAVGAS